MCRVFFGKLSFILWKIGRENKVPVLMPCNISKQCLNLYQLEWMSTRDEDEKKAANWKHKKIPQLFLERNTWNRFWREIILIICIIRQEERHKCQSSKWNLCCSQQGALKNTSAVYIVLIRGPRMYFFITYSVKKSSTDAQHNITSV